MSHETESAQAREERHASWIELFFDLVAVAGIGQLTHLLHGGPTLGDFAMYLLLYLAFWMAWASIMVYGNIAGERAKVPLVLVAMFGLGVMAAAVAGIPDRHATAFAAVYVLVRIFAEQVWGRGRILVDWPIAQLTAGVTPWIVSLWVPAPWKYWLWAIGMALDLLVMIGIDGNRMLAAVQERFDRRLRSSHRFDGIETPKLRALHTDSAHLGERLGLYMIIMLGEGIIVVIAAAAPQAWDLSLDLLVVGSFLLLVSMWALSLIFGFAGVPHLAPNQVAPRIAMGLHCLVGGAVATFAAGLGLAVEHAHGHQSRGVVWLLCGSAAAYFVIAAIGGLLTGERWRWFLRWPVPCTFAVLALGVFGSHLPSAVLIGILALVVAWPLLWEADVTVKIGARVRANRIAAAG
ncbi:low temperature requirement protein A [Nocardia sp. NPDC052566]|uniref:low temperature requirement protein A n=1 Tax=Nocardia sp. NPDC052566 TaxID=3364330 RepID=UPI0037CB262E